MKDKVTYLPALHLPVLLTMLFCLQICTKYLQQSYALPVPLTKQELYNASDFFGKIRTIGVVRLKDTTSFYGGIKVAQYQAWLQVLATYKGKLNKFDTILVYWHEMPKGMIGSWYVSFTVGEEAEVYLKRSIENTYYKSTSPQSGYQATYYNGYKVTYYNAKKILKEPKSNKRIETIGDWQCKVREGV